MSMKSSKFGPVKYGDGRTKQAFKDSTDINKLLAKAQRKGSVAHLEKYDAAVYGEFANYDLLEAHSMLARAQSIFDDLPSEVRREFSNDSLSFARFASDEANVGRLGELLPALAAPGKYFPDVSATTEPDALKNALTSALADVLEVEVVAPPGPVPDT